MHSSSSCEATQNGGVCVEIVVLILVSNLLPVLFVFWLMKSPRIGLACRRLLDARVWQTVYPLMILSLLFTWALSLVLSNWGNEFERPNLVFLASGSILTIALLVTWVLAHGISALQRPRPALLIGLALLCVLAWILVDAAFWRTIHTY